MKRRRKTDWNDIRRRQKKEWRKMEEREEGKGEERGGGRKKDWRKGWKRRRKEKKWKDNILNKQIMNRINKNLDFMCLFGVCHADRWQTMGSCSLQTTSYTPNYSWHTISSVKFSNETLKKDFCNFNFKLKYFCPECDKYEIVGFKCCKRFIAVIMKAICLTFKFWSRLITEINSDSV